MQRCVEVDLGNVPLTEVGGVANHIVGASPNGLGWSYGEARGDGVYVVYRNVDDAEFDEALAALNEFLGPANLSAAEVDCGSMYDD